MSPAGTLLLLCLTVGCWQGLDLLREKAGTTGGKWLCSLVQLALLLVEMLLGVTLWLRILDG